jgi:hypothetical protein
MEIAYEIKNYIKSNNGPCKVYPAPFDVILKNDNEDVPSAIQYIIYNKKDTSISS